MKNIFLSALMAFSFNLEARTITKKDMLQTVDTVAEYFEVMYAPAPLKRELFTWDLEQTITETKSKISSASDLSVAQFHRFLADFFLSTKDYHVGYGFHRTERAQLPMTIRSAEGRYFIVYINREKLDEGSFPYDIGTEVTKFDGRPIADVAAEIKTLYRGNVSETDAALAEFTLTNRRASRAISVPQGPVTLTVLEDKKPKTIQLFWDYMPEKIKTQIADTTGTDEMPSLAEKLKRRSFLSPVAKSFSSLDKDFAGNPQGLGHKDGFLPDFGKKIWETDSENPFRAYIFKNADSKLIGVVRIPSYVAGEKESFAFRDIIKHLEEHTDALIIDQLNNPGGSVFYLYSLVSYFVPDAAITPRHHMTITQSDLAESISFLKQTEDIKTREELVKAFGGEETIGGYPLTMNFLHFTRGYYQFLIDEWNAGRTRTNPYHIYGVDKINPSEDANYTKPVLLLVNELDFSGGDFFPGIMQDNKRATIMGTRTAGAGGYVLSQSFPNLVGLESFSITGSLAIRPDGTTLENLGVTPDIDYSFTANDYQNEYSDYRNKVLETISKMMK